MVPSLREQRTARTSQAIVAAALLLFSERGYDGVTVSEVAAAAGVGERTLYRYFADKEELLFAEDGDLRAALWAGIVDQPADQSAFTVLRRASAAVARVLQDRQADLRRRAHVIAGAPALTAREQAKHSAWAAVLADALSHRGVGTDEAALLGRIGVACHEEAFARWLAQVGPRTTLDAELDATFGQLGALLD